MDTDRVVIIYGAGIHGASRAILERLRELAGHVTECIVVEPGLNGGDAPHRALTLEDVLTVLPSGYLRQRELLDDIRLLSIYRKVPEPVPKSWEYAYTSGRMPFRNDGRILPARRFLFRSRGGKM